MAEAMEFDFSLPSNEGKKFDPELVEKVKRIQEEANGKSSITDIPEEFTIESYYTDDDLGADVLKNKYLAPWENHPIEIWKRQAKALASVEKNKTDVWVFTDRVCTTESSSLVLIPVLPFPPLFCCLTLLKAPLFI